MLLLVAPMLLSALAVRAPDEVLVPGRPLEGVLRSDAALVETPELLRRTTFITDAPPRGRAFPFQAGPGAWTIELTSIAFDPYLVVRDDKGELLAEDNDDLDGSGARIVLEVPPGGGNYEVWACALQGDTGPFTLRVLEGVAPRPAPPAEEGLEDPAGFVSRVHAEHGAGSPEAFDVLWLRAFEIRQRHGDHRMVALVRAALAALDPSLPDHDLPRARFGGLLLVGLLNMGEWAQAADVGRTAVPLLLATRPGHDENVANIVNFARVLLQVGAYEEALGWTRQGLVLAEAVHPQDSSEVRVLRDLHVTHLRRAGHWEEALSNLGEAVVLRPGPPFVGSVVPSFRHQSTAVLTRAYSAGPPFFESVPFTVEEDGTYTLDMRAHAFDAYLVLRDRDGRVLAEDDDGRGLRDARLVVRLDAGREYLLEPTGLHRGTGHYWIDLHAGPPRQLSARERRAAELAEVDEALRFADGWTGPVDRELVATLTHAADMLARLSRWDDVVGVRERILTLRTELDGPGSQAEIFTTLYLGEALMAAGRTPEALPLLQQVHDVLTRQRGAEQLPTSILIALARARAGRGDHETAVALYEKCLEIAERVGGSGDFLRPYLLGRLSALASHRGRAHEALELAQQVVDLYEEWEYGSKPGAQYLAAEALRALGRRQLAVDDAEGARRSFEEGLRLCLLAFGELSGRATLFRIDYAYLLWRLGDVRRALEAWREAHAEVEQRAPEAVALSLEVGAMILASAGKADEAYAAALRSIDASLQAHATHLATLPEPLRLRHLGILRSKLGLALGIGALVPGSERPVYERFLVVKGLVGRGLVESRARALADLDPATREMIAELTTLQSELARAFHDGDDARMAELRELRLEREDELALRQGVSGLRNITVAELADALPDESVLVDLYVSPSFVAAGAEDARGITPDWRKEEREQVVAFVVRSGRDEVVRVDLGPASALREALLLSPGSAGVVRGVSVETGDSQRATREGSDDLHRLLWRPLAPLVQEAPLVFVSTHGFLGALPFEVLQREDGSFLIEHHAFVYLADPTFLLEAAAAEGPAEPVPAVRGDLLLVGDVDYGVPSHGSGEDPPDALALAATLRRASGAAWPALPATRREVERIAELFAGLVDKDGRRPSATPPPATPSAAHVLTSGEATEEAVKRRLPGHTWVHVATHGFFQPERAGSMWESAAREAGDDDEGVAGLFPGLLSGLVLAGANGEGGAPDAEAGGADGLLTAEELTWLDLSDCELVVLSACETGLGSARGGEGLIGLRRAFHMAGAKTVVASMWAVEDEATRRLMESFYTHLWDEGRSRSAALRAAQLELLAANRSDSGDPRPSTWGAFVLSGAWR